MSTIMCSSNHDDDTDFEPQRWPSVGTTREDPNIGAKKNGE